MSEGKIGVMIAGISQEIGMILMINEKINVTINRMINVTIDEMIKKGWMNGMEMTERMTGKYRE